nr:hypothetical protein [Tanacetum cinerariifolium]
MTLADKAILSGADNRPPMLEKDMYDSWKSIMELYMMNRQHGQMVPEFVENGQLIWPTIDENGVTRPRKYSELTPAEAIQADCDVKETNIILQGLSLEVYALVRNHRIAKELWEIIQLLMHGTSLTKQERECKLYDEFDKFAYKKGETLRDLYLIFSLLLNDMNIYNVKLEQFQVNTKFLNTLPPEWSKFVTDVKLVRDLHTTNIDQLHAYLGQHKFHANEVWLKHERNSNLLGSRTTSFIIKMLEIKMNQVLNENERLLEQVGNKDIVNIVVYSSVDNAYVNVHECEKCLKLETELLNKKDFIEKDTYDKLFRSYTTLEKHCISLEVDTQLNQEIFQRDNSVSNQSAPCFDQ